MTNNANFDGPLGDCGKDTETSITANSLYASNTEGTVIAVALGGATSIPLHNNQNLDSFIPNGAKTIFTVPETGRYYITYQINTTAAVGIGAGSRILKI